MVSSRTTNLFIAFILTVLAFASLYMHSPLELKPTDNMYLHYRGNVESYSRDIVSYPAIWFDNPKMMRHNFVRFVSIVCDVINGYGYSLIFLLYSAIFLVSIYFTGYELFDERIYALVPCFIYYFGFMLPDMQNNFHDHELNARHFVLSLISLSFFFYVKGRKNISYGIAALIGYFSIRNGISWGITVFLLTIKDIIGDDRYRDIAIRCAVYVIISIPLIILTIPMYHAYDFSWLPEWAQYYAKTGSPGGRSLMSLLSEYGWNGLLGGIFGVVNGIALLRFFRDKKHIFSLAIVYSGSLFVGLAAGMAYDLWDIIFISKFYLLNIFSYLNLIQFYLLSFLFIDSFKKRSEIIHLFTCFYMLLLVPFYTDAVIQIGLTLLILLRFKTIGNAVKRIRVFNEAGVIISITFILLFYAFFIKVPHYIARWAEICYIALFTLIPFILVNAKGKYKFARFSSSIFISAVACLAVLSSVYGHSREKGRFDAISEKMDVLVYLEKNTDKSAFIIGPPKGINRYQYLNRLVVNYDLHPGKIQFDSKNIYPAILKRSDIMFEKGSLKKYFTLKMEGNNEEAEKYVAGFWENMDKAKVYRIKKEYDIDYIIREKELPIEGLEVFYENEAYIVYHIN